MTRLEEALLEWAALEQSEDDAAADLAAEIDALFDWQEDVAYVI